MKKQYLYYIIILLFWIYFLWKILSSSLGFNVNEISFLHKYIVSSFVPEGWGFFTRPPIEDQHSLYKIENAQEQLITFRNIDIRNLFGFSRKSRRVNLELQRVISKINDSIWGSNNEITIPVELSNMDNYIIYIKPGKYKLKKYKLVPWAWVKYVKYNSISNDSLTILIK